MSGQHGSGAPANSVSEPFPETGAQPHREALDDLTPLNHNTPSRLRVHANGAHSDAENRVPADMLFNYMIAAVSFFINDYHRALSSLNPYDAVPVAEKLANQIMNIIKGIPINCQQYPDPETHFKGLLALCKIGEIILRAGNTELGDQVRGYFDGISVLERAMIDVIGQMTPEEIAVIQNREGQDDDRQLLPKLQILQEEGRWCLLYDNMHLVIDALQDPSLLHDNSNGDEN
ncbi:hypothetical protein PMG11_07630 [Penicillium brasilianum]|uniref:Uncharacterized protein n=1 Tax=Penicillium brasilianum TaxID=104259 RepID=A0A0F7TV72_PENBI|nr:hypothetical protein PMG11_07630 [Penicillium brasilianum]